MFAGLSCDSKANSVACSFFNLIFFSFYFFCQMHFCIILKRRLATTVLVAPSSTQRAPYRLCVSVVSIEGGARLSQLCRGLFKAVRITQKRCIMYRSYRLMHDNLYMCMSATSNNGVCHTEIGLCTSVSAAHHRSSLIPCKESSATSAEICLKAQITRAHSSDGLHCVAGSVPWKVFKT